MMGRIRLLPVVIFVAALTLTIKLGAIWQDVEVKLFPPAVAEAKPDARPDAKPGAKPGAKKDEIRTAKAGQAAPDGESAGQPAEGTAGDTATDSGAEFDPAFATNAEIEVLQRLASRREILARRSRELEMQATMLVATERRIDVKIIELRKIKTTIEGLLKKYDAEQEAKLRSLVKIYENMKPKLAARIFERLEMVILLDVVERMRETKTAPIMASMSPAKARTLTSALVERRSLPPPTRSGGAAR